MIYKNDFISILELMVIVCHYYKQKDVFIHLDKAKQAVPVVVFVFFYQKESACFCYIFIYYVGNRFIIVTKVIYRNKNKPVSDGKG